MIKANKSSTANTKKCGGEARKIEVHFMHNSRTENILCSLDYSRLIHFTFQAFSKAMEMRLSFFTVLSFIWKVTLQS